MNGQSRGACGYCGRETTRAHMARHLDSCEKRLAAVAEADAHPGPSRLLLHVQVRDAFGGDFWLNLEMDGSAPLKKLDAYLRAIWLECCGHLSAFQAGGWGGRRMAMSERAERVLLPGVELTHVYDMGEESVTLLRSVGTRHGKPLTRYPIALMARNDLPPSACQTCGEPAAQYCRECRVERDRPGFLCARHARRHTHRAYGPLLPLVNSPRFGMCGYEGPADPPY
jgi:hypothetical protein